MSFKNTLHFLAALKDNNNREWFEKNRSWYEESKAEFENFVESLIAGIGKFDLDVRGLTAKQCTFRQYRDVRFSRDKRPFKINMGAYLNKGGKKINTAGYYFHLEPGKSLFAGGLWMPEAVPLFKVRQEIDYNYTEWKNILQSPGFKKAFSTGLDMNDSLKRAPKNFETDSEALDFIRLKSFIARQDVEDKTVLQQDFHKVIIQKSKIVKPLLDFLNRSIM